MNSEDIKNLLQDKFPKCRIEVIENQGQYKIMVVGEEFAGMNEVARQQKIYAPLASLITTGKIHAVTVKGNTEKEISDN